MITRGTDSDSHSLNLDSDRCPTALRAVCRTITHNVLIGDSTCWPKAALLQRLPLPVCNHHLQLA